PRGIRQSGYEVADQCGIQDASGCVIYRIVKDNGQGSSRYKVVSVLALILLISFAVTRTVDGQVPTAADFAACNEEGPRTVKMGSASPTTRDHVRADSARGGAITTGYTDVTGQVIASSDPQIHGMKAEGAKNATYQADR